MATPTNILEDLRACLAVAKTEHCKSLLQKEMEVLETAEAAALAEANAAPVATAEPEAVSSSQESSKKETAQLPDAGLEQATTQPVPAAKSVRIPDGMKDSPITQYAWDQSEKFVSLYITLAGDRDLIETEYPDQHTAILRVLDFKAKKRHILKLVNLCKPIDIVKSKALNKSSNVVFKLKKITAAEKWTALDDSVDKKAEAREKRMKTDLKDASTMDLISDMFKHGDDDTRRSLQDAMAKNQQVRAEKGEVPAL